MHLFFLMLDWPFVRCIELPLHQLKAAYVFLILKMNCLTNTNE